MSAVAMPQMDGKERMLKYPQLGGPRGAFSVPPVAGDFRVLRGNPGGRVAPTFLSQNLLGRFSPRAVMPLRNAALESCLYPFSGDVPLILKKLHLSFHGRIIDFQMYRSPVAAVWVARVAARRADRRRTPRKRLSKLILDFLTLKRSQTREFRVVQKSSRPCENSEARYVTPKFRGLKPRRAEKTAKIGS